jgi:predicted RNA-binding protein with RPS1 domain
VVLEALLEAQPDKDCLLNIVDPPKAEIGKTYMGRVVNITKFGAFVNILPGRDGLVHISKLGGGKRINAVEDVLELGQEIEVVVEEIDDKGKVSLTPAGDAPAPKEGGSSNGGGDRAPRRERSSNRSDNGESSGSGGGTDVVEVSFEESFVRRECLGDPRFGVVEVVEVAAVSDGVRFEEDCGPAGEIRVEAAVLGQQSSEGGLELGQRHSFLAASQASRPPFFLS